MSEEKTKAILIMDMPSRCGECTVCHMVGSNALCQAKMGATYTMGRLTAIYTKPDWCPLCEMPKWLYRLESISPQNGLWYNSDNEYVNTMSKLENCKTKDLPMGYDERYHKDGKCWFSSCSNKDDLMHWYSLQDALYLIANGFVFTRYLATEYVEYENETTFIKETCLAREEISIEELFKEELYETNII